MSTTIYYFSATGNSLTSAKMLAGKLSDCRLVPVASVKDNRKIIEESDCVGFVFPVYYGNMPYPVREMVSKMVFKPETYIFTCMTYRGHAGAAAKRMDQLLRTRGQKLSLSLGLPMPGNSFINEPQVDAEYLAKQSENIAAIAPRILAREAEDYADPAVLPMTPIDYPNNFRGIMADDVCTGCGVCAQVCPMGNISIANGKAVIGDDCATCLACFHWCPAEAIWMSRQENIARRKKYRHPDTVLADIIAQKG